MREIERIIDQMDRAFSGDAWHGPSLMSLLDGIPAQDASTHSAHGVHSIWELVHHIAAWKTIVQQRVQGEKVEVTTALDWPPVWEASEAEWQRSVENLAARHSRLRAAAAKLRDDELDEIPAITNVSRYAMLHGVVQHDLYHAGQIAILKKAFL